MGREFTMGARINLETGRYSSNMSQAIRATNNFSEEVLDADRAMDRYTDSQGRARTSNGRFASSASNVTNQLEQQGRQATSLKDKLFSLQGVVAAVAGSMAIKGAFNWLVGANADMEQYQNTLSVVLGSQEKAVEQLKWAEKFAASTPFEIPSIVEATTRLESYGIESKKVLGITGDMASVMGKDLMQAVEAVADAQTGELERLKEFGITKKMLEEQAKLMGSNPVNNKGQITDQEAFNSALFALMEERFKGGMEMQAKSFKGMLSNASDFISSIGRRLGAPIFEGLKDRLGGVLEWANRLNESGAVDGFIAKVHKGFKMLGTAANFVKNSVFLPIAQTIQNFISQNSGNFSILGTAFKNVFATLKRVALPVLNWLVYTAFPAVLTAIKQAASFVVSLASTFVTNFQKFKPYIIGVVTALTAYWTYLKIVAAWTKIVAAAQAIFNAVMAMNPVMLVVIAIGLLIGYLIHLAGGWDVVKQKLLVLWQYMLQAWQSIKATVVPIIISLVQTVITWFKNIWLAVAPLLQTIWQGIVNIFQSIQVFWQQWGGLITNIFQVLWAFVSSIFLSALKIIWSLVKGWFTYMSNIISGIFKVISGIVQVGWALVSGIFSTALSLLSGDWEGAWDNMLDMLSGVWSGIEDFFGGLKDLFFDSGKAIMQTLADGIKEMATAPFKAVGSALGKVRELLPFSDAHEGPLSQLTHNGGKIVSTMAEGVYKQRGALASAMDNVLGNTPGVNIQAGTANPAGAVGGKGNVTKTITIEKLIEKLEISGAEGKNAKELAQEIIAEIYEILKGADEIESAGLGEIL